MSVQEKKQETELEVQTSMEAKKVVQDPSSHCNTSSEVRSCGPCVGQQCPNVPLFSASAAICSLCLQIVSVYLSSQVTSLEKQFGLSSSDSGILLSCNDIGYLSAILIFSHFGRKGHMPRILGVTALTYGLAGIVCGLPQFIEPAYLPNVGTTGQNTSHDQENNLCSSNESIQGSNDTCNVYQSGHSGSSHWVFYLLALSFVLQGVCKSPRSPMTTVYIDNNVQVKTQTGLFVGVVAVASLFGPALAFSFGGIISRIPVDLRDTLLTPTDTRWIGAWWLGFFIFGGISAMVAVPLFFFPRKLKGSWKETQKQQDKPDELSLCQKIRGFPTALISVVGNPVHTLILLAGTLITFTAGGYISFGPKYMETVLLIPAWKANTILGIQAAASAGIGTFLGGYLTSRFKLNLMGCLKFVVGVGIVSVCLEALNFTFGCQYPVIYGLESNSPLVNGSTSECECDDVQFLPVCGVNTQRTYSSPCHAGCHFQNETLYGGCIADPGSDVTLGICDQGCPYLYPFVLATLGSNLFSTLGIVPVDIIMLRSVREEHKTMAVGTLSFVTSLLGFFPAPIVYGKVIDTTCRLWNYTCGTRGSCALYDIVDLRLKMVGITVGVRAVGSALFFIAFLVTKMRSISDEKALPRSDTTDTSF